MRLIDADALKEQIRKTHGIRSLDYLLPIEKEIVKEVDSAPTIDIPTWIPCSERLPQIGMEVLVTMRKHGDVTVGKRYNENLWDIPVYDAFYVYNEEVIAWMPRPYSYKEKNDEESL